MSFAILLATIPLLGLVLGQWKHFRTLALCIVFGSVVANIGYWYWWFAYGDDVTVSFDSAAWKASLSQDDSDPIRLEMVDSLLESHHLPGMSRGEVISLIGQPPKTPYFKDYDFVYWLGPERGGFRIDSEWLAIRFDDTGHVRKARVVRD